MVQRTLRHAERKSVLALRRDRIMEIRHVDHVREDTARVGAQVVATQLVLLRQQRTVPACVYHILGVDGLPVSGLDLDAVLANFNIGDGCVLPNFGPVADGDSGQRYASDPGERYAVRGRADVWG